MVARRLEARWRARMKKMRSLMTMTLVPLLLGTAAAQQGDVARGQRLFQNCIACHSLEPDKNLTGPSLSGVIGRKAGKLQSFSRYSDAIRSSGVVWDVKTLDTWLADPQHVIPGNQMTFPGNGESATACRCHCFSEAGKRAQFANGAANAVRRWYDGRHDEQCRSEFEKC